MNKALYSAAIVIIALSSVALIFFASSPIVDSCVTPLDDSTSATTMTAVVRCAVQETTDWQGVGLSIAALAAGIGLATYGAVALKKRQ